MESKIEQVIDIVLLHYGFENAFKVSASFYV